MRNLITIILLLVIVYALHGLSKKLPEGIKKDMMNASLVENRMVNPLLKLIIK